MSLLLPTIAAIKRVTEGVQLAQILDMIAKNDPDINEAVPFLLFLFFKRTFECPNAYTFILVTIPIRTEVTLESTKVRVASLGM
jgi:hypothetical protein